MTTAKKINDTLRRCKNVTHKDKRPEAEKRFQDARVREAVERIKAESARRKGRPP